MKELTLLKPADEVFEPIPSTLIFWSLFWGVRKIFENINIVHKDSDDNELGFYAKALGC